MKIIVQYVSSKSSEITMVFNFSLTLLRQRDSKAASNFDMFKISAKSSIQGGTPEF